MNPRVVNVVPNKDYSLTLTFSNDEVRAFDMTKYLDIGVFKELKDYDVFQTVKVSMGSIRWIHGQDLCPDTLFLYSVPVKK